MTEDKNASSTSSAVSAHPFGRAVIRVINRVITLLEILLFVFLLVFAVYAIWDNQRIDSENTSDAYEMYKPTAEDTRTYDDFAAANPDVCGWLAIDDTGIDYPLVQGEDNDTYMNTTADGRFALSGAIFLDYRNDRQFGDFNTVIYGHHMEGPSMFGALDQYDDADFFQSHETGTLYYDGQWHALDIFAFLEVDAYDQEIYSICEEADASEDAGAASKQYLDYIRAHASQYQDIGVNSSDHIIVMSTCMTDETNGRYIVCARIGGITDPPSQEDAAAVRADTYDGSLRLRRAIIAIIIAAIVVAVLLVLLHALHKARSRKKTAQAVTAEGQTASVDRQAETADAQPVSAEATKEDTDMSGGMHLQEGTGSRAKRQSTKKPRTFASDLVDLLIRIAIIAAVIWVIFHFIFGIFVNSGVGMEPSVQDRDIVLYYRLENAYRVNEAVVYEADGGERLGRIVAQGGDTVEITDEGLKVNGYLQQDYKSEGETLAAVGGPQYPLTLAADEVFILGDNREESTDSRMFGPVKLDDVLGSVQSVLRRRDV